MALEENYWLRQAADRCRQSYSRTSSRPGARSGQVNIMEFCKQFNARTSEKSMEGLTIPVVITVYGDRTFSFSPRLRPHPTCCFAPPACPRRGRS